MYVSLRGNFFSGGREGWYRDDTRQCDSAVFWLRCPKCLVFEQELGFRIPVQGQGDAGADC